MKVVLAIVALLGVVFVGCGSNASVSSGSETNTPKTITLNARVVDGYIKDAKVCLDTNLNAVCDVTELIITTSPSGVVTFTNIKTSTGAYLSIIASGGTDTATGKVFTGEFKSVISVDRINSSYEYLTPLTDLIATGFLAGTKSSVNYEVIKNLVSNAYTIDNRYINQNPMAYSGVYARTQEIQQTIGLLQETTINVEGIELTVIEKEQLQRDIKNALLSQIMNEGTLDVIKTVTYLALIRKISFTQNVKTYLDEQLREIKLSIDEFTNTANLTVDNLNNYQIALEKEADAIYLAMKSMNGNSPLSVIPVNINIKEILATTPDNNETNSAVPDAGVGPNAPVDTRIIVAFGGYVVDGYIEGASICMDLNYNGLCDTSEPTVSSQVNGGYSFSNIEVKKDSVIPIISYGGIDTVINKQRISQLQSVVNTNALSTLNLTPITDYIATAFSEEDIKSVESLAKNVTNLGTGFSLSAEQLYIDPMQDVQIFALSQELEYTRRILEQIIGLPINTALQNEIKKAMLSQIVQNSYETLSINQVITTLEIALNTSISNVKFAESQIAEIQKVLDIMKTSEEIQVYTLTQLQSKLEESVASAIENLTYTQITLTPEEVSYSDFSKTSALYDEQACISDTQYVNTLTDSNTTTNSNSEYTQDSVNGLLINSDANELKMYYENISQTLDGNKIVEFLDDSNYYFAFDKVWQNKSKIIYIQLPKNEGNKYSCYRVALDTDISYTKVFRYTSLIK
ncbi:hypothetical protein JHD49_04365 [Sulfurimonas sp. SAG-AH-194-C21]|nr:hypothetical protein [Sulfurimonas sp. SAG-AH-194-C21]MDF1883165.1 hypothetical protein [Sulfurimonas sp. SAG-AH-194-C21]